MSSEKGKAYKRLAISSPRYREGYDRTFKKKKYCQDCEYWDDNNCYEDIENVLPASPSFGCDCFKRRGRK